MPEPPSTEPSWVQALRFELEGYQQADLLYRGLCFELLRSAGQNPGAFEGLGADRLVAAVRWSQIIKGMGNASHQREGAEGGIGQHPGTEV